MAGALSISVLRLVFRIEHEVLVDDGDLVVQRGQLAEDLLGDGAGFGAAKGLREENELDWIGDDRKVLLESCFVLRRKRPISDYVGSGSGINGTSELEEIVEGLLGAAGFLWIVVWLTAVVVSRSQVVRPEKCGQSFATSLGDTRAVSFTAHSKVVPGSKFTHWTHDRKSTWHLGHLLRDMISASTMVPQREQRATWREPIMRGLRAPSEEMRRAPAGAPVRVPACRRRCRDAAPKACDRGCRLDSRVDDICDRHSFGDLAI